MKNVLVCIADSNGCYPVPASKGGAVSTLVEHLVAQNDKKCLVNMTIVSYYDDKAIQMSTKYPNINFVWIKVPKLIKYADACIYWGISHLTNIKATSFLSLLSLIIYTIKSSRIIKKGNYDSVVLEHNIPMAWMIRLSGYKGDYYHHFHNIPRVNAKCKSVFDRCKRFLCISEYMANDIKRDDSPIGPVRSEQVALVYNCIDTTLFKPISKQDNKYTRDKFGLSENDHVIIFTGRITWEKGVDKILEALNYINTPNLKILVVGSLMMNQEIKDEYSEKLHMLAEKHEGKVKFTGYIQHCDIPMVYNLADIAVLPSMWEEPAGLTMLEAMACGLPTVTTKSGGIPEYVGDAAIVLDRTEDISKRIAVEVDRLFADKDLYKFYRKNGIERINKHFSLSNYLERFVEVV